MKTNPLLYACIAAVAGLTAFYPQLQAEEERPSVERVLEFLKEKMPESMGLLERVRSEEGEDEYAEVLEGAGELMMEYIEIKSEEGEQEAEAFLEEERGMIQVESLVEAWHESEDESEKRAFEKEIAELIGKQIDRELAHGRRELEALEAEVDEFREELADIEENRETIIAEELKEILSDEDEGDWEDDEKGDEEE